MQQLGQVQQQFADQFMKAIAAGPRPEFGEIFQSLSAGLQHEAAGLAQMQMRYAQDHMRLWSNLLGAGQGAQAEPVVVPDKGDRRFHGAEWKELPLFDFLRQQHLLNTRWVSELVESSRLDPQTKRKAAFFARQYLDALAPSNYPATNPEVLKLALETEGASIAAGLKNLMADIEKGRISMTDESVFEVGRNLAVTEGTVVYENELMQLIRYRPLTAEVYERPFLMVPPFINKYYLLDMQPDNSLVRYLLEQGQQVFLVSWRNITPELGAKTWDDYVEHAVFKAMEVALDLTGQERLNVLGFCVGGTLLSSALAVLRARGDERVASLTLLTTMLDFSDVGEISVYVDPAYVEKREADFRDGGLMHGRELATTFASLRANELIWFFVVNNYLKGRTPEAFDLLYWNSDSANLPGRLYVWYVRNMYLENNLRVPGKLSVLDTPVDLGKVDIPAFILATREDHIVPWMSAYASARLLGGEKEFVLAASGHIAGVINPASKNRRNYWTGEGMPADPQQWMAAARQLPGSWWPHFSDWLGRRAGERVPAPQRPGSERYPEIEPAPGRYVKVRDHEAERGVGT
ncbi:MAG TPA: class I poly(R)-hydroxyalkanoic acid synthase [Burkholderiales bacterium]|nr:class I poly(R)-hydroxyalkanoic acid synthase [Burkholderiales bacterium]